MSAIGAKRTFRLALHGRRVPAYWRLLGRCSALTYRQGGRNAISSLSLNLYGEENYPTANVSKINAGTRCYLSVERTGSHKQSHPS